MKKFRFLLVLMVVLVLAVPAMAQEISLPVIPAATGDPVQTLADNLFSLIYNATFLPFAAGMVTLLVALSKRISFLNGVSPQALALFWTVVLWALWTMTNEIGYGSVFESVVTMLTSLGSAVLGVAITPMAAGALYGAAKANGVAVFGYHRTPRLAVVEGTLSPASPSEG